MDERQYQGTKDLQPAEGGEDVYDEALRRAEGAPPARSEPTPAQREQRWRERHPASLARQRQMTRKSRQAR